MPRVLIAEGCREVDFGGVRHYARGGQKGYQQGGSFDMSPAAARQAVKIGGAIASEAGTTSRTIGWRCPSCQFGSFVKTCSRCGAECERE
jgi:hypothetical protein